MILPVVVSKCCRVSCVIALPGTTGFDVFVLVSCRRVHVSGLSRTSKIAVALDRSHFNKYPQRYGIYSHLMPLLDRREESKRHSLPLNNCLHFDKRKNHQLLRLPSLLSLSLSHTHTPQDHASIRRQRVTGK